MPHPVDVFENEEASKLLDYFVAYKKLTSKVEYIKCISALNSEVRFCQNQPTKGLPKDLTAKPYFFLFLENLFYIRRLAVF